MQVRAFERYIPLMQREHSAILSTFIKLPIVNKIFVLSIFLWPFYTGFTVFNCFSLWSDIIGII